MTESADTDDLVRRIATLWKAGGSRRGVVEAGTAIHLFAPVHQVTQLPIHYPLTFSFSREHTDASAAEYRALGLGMPEGEPVVTSWRTRFDLDLVDLPLRELHATVRPEVEPSEADLRAAIQVWGRALGVHGVRLLPPPEHRLVLLSPRKCLEKKI